MRNIGTPALSQTAPLLEKAGREGAPFVLRDALPAFREDPPAMALRLGAFTAAGEMRRKQIPCRRAAQKTTPAPLDAGSKRV
ncbi:MAG: hypothetical protein LBP38_08790 [Desulfovibrio sp.]|nr:hypothetical protein [Desulfovibrio sp.]